MSRRKGRLLFPFRGLAPCHNGNHVRVRQMSHTASINSIYITSSGNVHTGCSKPFGDLYLRNRTSVFNVSPDAFRIITNRCCILSLHSKLVIVTGSEKLVNVRQVHSLTHNKSKTVDIPSDILYKQDRLQVMTTGIRTRCPYISRL